MTQVLTIPTPFADLSELTENFAQRVDEQRLMLPNLEPVTEGEWVQFSVLLGDGTVALAGVGRVQGSYDNGEEHPPEYRFDVVVDSLQLEGMHEVMFERLLVARSTQMGGEPVTGEVSVEDLEREQAQRQAAAQQSAAEAVGAEPIEAALDATGEGEQGWEDAGGWAEGGDDGTMVAPGSDEAAGAPNDGYEDASQHAGHADDGEGAYAAPQEDAGTGEIDVGDVEDVAPAAAAPRARGGDAAPPRPPAAPYPTMQREPGKLPSPHSFNGVALTRPSLPAAWSPEPEPRPEAAQSSGYFDYQGGVPRPARPPRPELDESQRVRPAPRPGAPWPRRATGQHVALAAASDAAAYAEPEQTGGYGEDAATAGFEEVGVEDDGFGGGELPAGDETSQHELPEGGGEHEEW